MILLGTHKVKRESFLIPHMATSNSVFNKLHLFYLGVGGLPNILIMLYYTPSPYTTIMLLSLSSQSIRSLQGFLMSTRPYLILLYTNSINSFRHSVWVFFKCYHYSCLLKLKRESPSSCIQAQTDWQNLVCPAIPRTLTEFKGFLSLSYFLGTFYLTIYASL